MLRVIGLISGTSVDGVDAALVEISGTLEDLQVTLLAGETYPYPEDLREQILRVCGRASLSMAEFATLDDAIAHTFAQAALAIQSGQPKADLIGSHGQTVYHRPPQIGMKQEGDSSDAARSPQPLSSLGYSLQLGRGTMIAELTRIPTVSNFRAADIAAGGQGAPLVSKVDACLLGHYHQTRCIQNLGGIGNVTYLPKRQEEHWETQIVGWDTGPGNSLLDLAIQQFTGGAEQYDRAGNRASQGTPCQELVNQWLQQDFFHQPPPKSTGRELFGSAYLEHCLIDAQSYHLSPEDLLSTLTELTAASIAQSYRTFLPQLPDQVLLCGGGSRNLYLKQRIQALLDPVPVAATEDLGLSVDFKEAIAFAVLAYWRQKGIPGNLPKVTGARAGVLLGDFSLVT